MVNTPSITLVAVLMAGPSHALDERGPEAWQKLAQQDLDAAKQLILDAHPGAIDALNPELREWIDIGHREASALVPEIFSYDSMLAVVRYYIAGFRDGHLVYSDNARPNDTPMFTTGWRVEHQEDRVVVTAVAPEWKTQLPPLGAQLLSCDGLKPNELVDERVAPYVDRRGFAQKEKLLLQGLDLLTLKRHALRRCEFKNAAGESIWISAGYQSMTADAYWAALITPAAKRSAQRANAYSLRDRVLWIGAHDFSLAPEQVPALRTMLTELQSLDGFDAIVFDVRGNTGGDGSVGDKILRSATGGLVFDRTEMEALPRIYAQWRVSNLAIRSAHDFLDRRLAQYGDGSDEVAYAKAHLNSLEHAKVVGHQWVEQPAGHRVGRTEVKRRGGRFARFDGQTLLLTDHACASACLDFADAVLLAPNAVHAGQETSGDSVYIDTARETMPSGNVLVVPLKVWRNRLRGNNETLKPDVPIALDEVSDDSARQKVLQILQR